jgi:DNA repair protein RadC
MKKNLLNVPHQNLSEILREHAPAIKHWSEDDRPREKLLMKGKNALSDAELLAIILNSGNKYESALSLSKRILASVGGNLDNLAKLSIAKLKEFRGIGEAKAIAIAAAIELGNRKQHSAQQLRPQVTCSQEAYQAIRSVLEDLPHEEFWILHLNHSLKLIKKERISTGGLAATVVDIRLISKSCIENLTTNLILCHNHPSEKLQASEADIKITDKVKNALSIFDIHVRDHIIVGGKQYFSFADNGML